MSLPIQSIIINEEKIKERVRVLGQQITREYRGKEVILLSVLKGSFVFLADLMRALDLDVEIGFMYLSSYQGNQKGDIRHIDIPCPSLANRHVLLVEDILDSGESLDYAWNWCQQQNPASLKTCVFLIKEDVPRKKNPPVDYLGFHIPNEFAVGYGLDYREHYRNLPFIAVPEIEDSLQ